MVVHSLGLLDLVTMVGIAGLVCLGPLVGAGVVAITLMYRRGD